MVVYFDDILIYNQTQEQYVGHLRRVLCTLQAEKFYANPKKCAFCIDRVIFLRFVILSEGVSADPEKVKVITEWPQPRTIKEVGSFYGLATFYRQFIKKFSDIMAPITDCLKSEGFQWTPAASKAFAEIKRMTEALLMRLPEFSKAFEVTCDASRLAISGVLSQESHPVVYFSEKLNDVPNTSTSL